MHIEMKNISKSFFGAPVLEGVDFSVDKAEIHALLGENGAGKTTLMNILYGLYAMDDGEILIDGKPTKIASPNDAIALGIGMVHQHFQLVDTLTVSENITLGLKSSGFPFSNRKQINQHITDVSKRFQLQVFPEKRIRDLSVGERQRVEIMKLLYREAKVLILDEPTAVLSPPEVDAFFDVLVDLKKAGHSIVIITHKIHEVRQICDRVTVLRDGACVLQKPLVETDATELSKAMIGRVLPVCKREQRDFSKQPPRLVLENLTVREHGLDLLNRFSLTLAPGEIVGVAGVDGNGQRELAESIVGIKRLTSGSVELDGKILNEADILTRMNAGVGYIPADRHDDAVLLSMNLKHNLLLKKSFSKEYQKHGLIDEQKTAQVTSDLIEQYSIKTQSTNVPMRYLSGGNQQKFVLARELDSNLKILVAFQPTRGLDMGAMDFIQNELLTIAKQGTSILLISTDLQEILALSDRIAVLYGGANMGVMKNDETLDLNRIGQLMGGDTHEPR